jgi:hypothetical protein
MKRSFNETMFDYRTSATQDDSHAKRGRTTHLLRPGLSFTPEFLPQKVT